MGADSKIEWTDATWNPVRGCTRVSPGCGGPGPHGGCYAEIMAARFSNPGQWGHGFAEMRNGYARWTGKVALIESQLALPLKWKTPRKIFVNSTSDLFHEALSDEAIDRVFAIMQMCPQHIFQVLTKRAKRMQAYFGHPLTLGRIDEAFDDYCNAHDFNRDAPDYPWAHVWLGVSVEDQERADERIPDLLGTPAAVRFLSCEPLLGPLDLSNVRERLAGESFMTFDALAHPDTLNKGACRQGLDWIIAGGESGPDARPMHPEWARGLRDQCAAAGVPFFFKQWGEWRHAPDRAHFKELIREPQRRIESRMEGVRPAFVVREGKKAAGRLLDGREHNDFPRLDHVFERSKAAAEAGGNLPAYSLRREE